MCIDHIEINERFKRRLRSTVFSTQIKETLAQYQSYCKIFISFLRLCQMHINFFQFKLSEQSHSFAIMVLCMARTIVLWKKTSRKNILNNEVQNYSTFLCRLFVSNLCESYDTTAHVFSANFYWNAINHHAQDLFDFQLFQLSFLCNPLTLNLSVNKKNYC